MNLIKGKLGFTENEKEKVLLITKIGITSLKLMHCFSFFTF